MDVSFRSNLPAFMAYSKLTLVDRSSNTQKGIPSHSEMSFPDFLKTLHNDEVVNKDYARDLPDSEVQNSQVDARIKGDYRFEADKLSFIEKAYKLGIVDNNGSLVDLAA